MNSFKKKKSDCVICEKQIYLNHANALKYVNDSNLCDEHFDRVGELIEALRREETMNTTNPI